MSTQPGVTLKMPDKKFSWVDTHKGIVNYLKTKENNQQELIELLKSVGITKFKDKDVNDDIIELEVIDPFTFFCYIYKHGSELRLKYLKRIAKKLNLEAPNDDDGIPSANAQKVWLFPYKKQRNNNEISRLWKFFYSIIYETMTDKQFQDALNIHNTGSTKLTEALFYVNPEKYLPINGPTKPYIKEVLGLDTQFNSYTEYMKLLEQIKGKIGMPFYELSYEAWKWKAGLKTTNYWIFQGNPKIYDVVSALNDNAISTWRVKSHEDQITIGDKIILWLTGKFGGCYALAEVVSNVYQALDEVEQMKYYIQRDKNGLAKRVKIKVTHNLSKNPITKDQIDTIKELSKLKVGNQGTNFSATKEEFEAILGVAEDMNKTKYWIYAPGPNAEFWEEFYEEGIMALGWDALGDLNSYKTKEAIVKKLQALENTKSSKKNDATANFEFKEVLSVGDVVIVKKGLGALLGYGVITSKYFYDQNRTTYKHCRKVDWKQKGNWKTDQNLVLKTLTDITKYPSSNPAYATYYESLLATMGGEIDPPVFAASLNIILYGPPGTGKTYHAVRRAAEIIENRTIDNYDEAKKIFKENLHNRIEFITFHQNYSYEDFIQGLRPDIENDKELTFERKDGVFKVISDRALKNIVESEQPQTVKKKFEDIFNQYMAPLIDGEVEELEVQMKKVSFFITTITNKSISFRKTSGGTSHTLSIGTLRKMYEAESVLGIQGLASYYKPLLIALLKLGKDATGREEKVIRQNYVIVIDEINRANISRVFGELITLIEPDKRSHGSIPMEATLPSGDSFIVPSNLYIIGTMNTADKSIALLDIALRRRFEFESIYPIYSLDDEIYDIDILKKINGHIIKTKGYDFQIGHAYFMGENKDLLQRMNKKVIPLLLEYYMNDEKEVKNILSQAGLKIDDNSWPITITGKSD